jgi:hypothetical protein
MRPMKLVKVLDAHCTGCGTESTGWRGWTEDDPRERIIPYPVVVPMDVVRSEGAYICEVCGGTVVAAFELSNELIPTAL